MTPIPPKSIKVGKYIFSFLINAMYANKNAEKIAPSGRVSGNNKAKSQSLVCIFWEKLFLSNVVKISNNNQNQNVVSKPA